MTRFKFGKGKQKPVASVNVAGATEDLHRALSIRWWRWRHVYLEAKRLQISQRRDEAGGL